MRKRNKLHPSDKCSEFRDGVQGLWSRVWSVGSRVQDPVCDEWSKLSEEEAPSWKVLFYMYKGGHFDASIDAISLRSDVVSSIKIPSLSSVLHRVKSSFIGVQLCLSQSGLRAQYIEISVQTLQYKAHQNVFNAETRPHLGMYLSIFIMVYCIGFRVDLSRSSAASVNLGFALNTLRSGLRTNLSHRMYLLIRFRTSTPPQNRQLVV